MKKSRKRNPNFESKFLKKYHRYVTCCWIIIKLQFFLNTYIYIYIFYFLDYPRHQLTIIRQKNTRIYWMKMLWINIRIWTLQSNWVFTRDSSSICQLNKSNSNEMPAINEPSFYTAYRTNGSLRDKNWKKSHWIFVEFGRNDWTLNFFTTQKRFDSSDGRRSWPK